jgi:hypoxanthine phosphoribosyltransferase
MPEPNAHRFAIGSELRVETLDWPTVYSLCRKLVEIVSHDRFIPDLVIGIYDPGAAGGYPVAAQLASLMQELPNEPSIAVGVIRIDGRSTDRGVSKLPVILAGVTRILLVDDVAWSGATFRIASRSLAAATGATIRSCALLAGRQAIDEGHVQYYGRVAVARDALFPWG